MASLVDQIPAELLNRTRQEDVIKWLRALNVPRRFKRKLLQDWGEAVGAALEGADYEQVEKY